MTHELRNPFKDARPSPETPTDEQVVGGVLGAEAVRAMRELRGSTGRATGAEESTDIDVVDIKLTQAEQLAAREVEDGPRQEMIDWARTFGKDEEWVDEEFTFHADGTIESTKKDLDLRFLGVASIPKILHHVEGLEDLYLHGNKLTTIENLPEGLRRAFLNDNAISKLENLPPSLEWLDITGNNISTIENLPAGLQTLYLDENNVSRLENFPKGLRKLSLADMNLPRLENLPDGLETLWLNRSTLSDTDGLPAPGKIGSIIFSKGQHVLAERFRALGHTVHVGTL